MLMIYFIICLGASVLGAISGIGGGVIIKPLLDMLGTLDVSTISFLSGCTVLSMTMVTLYRTRHSDVKVDKKKGTYLAIGAAIGGVCGKQIFELVKTLSSTPALVGAAQSFILALITFGVLIFTLKKSRITPYHVENMPISMVIGFGLGCISSFLGIGGGPINLAVLYLFFAMDTKTAAINSIYIIFFSQITSLIQSLVTGTVPSFELPVFLLMISGGVLGGIIGPMVSKRLSLKGLDKIFIAMVIIITMISIYNGFGYLALLG